MTLTFVLIMMFMNDWQLTFLVLIPMPFASYAVYRLGKLVNKIFTDRQEQFSLLTTRAQETLSGVRIVKHTYAKNTKKNDFTNSVGNI